MDFLLSLDNGILNAIQHLRCDFLDWFFPRFTILGNGGWFYILVATLLLCFPKTRRAGHNAALALIFCLLAGNLTLKPLIGRIRPHDANGFTQLLVPRLGDFSFPSGHTFGATAVAVSLLFYHKKAGIVACIFTALMAFSRLYLYVHYPSDVLGGILLGTAAAFLARYLLRRLYARKQQKTEKPTT